MSDQIFQTINFEALIKSQKKGDRRKIQIAESVIKLIHRDGLENLSYEKIAQSCKVVRGVIYSYFPTLTDVLLFTCQMIRFRFQNFVILEVRKQSTPRDMLIVYIAQALLWTIEFPNDSTVWLLFFHKCCISPELSKANSQWVDMGIERIVGLIDAGTIKGEFALPKSLQKAVARQIQLLITGELISLATESRSPQDWQREKEMIIQLSLNLCQAAPRS